MNIKKSLQKIADAKAEGTSSRLKKDRDKRIEKAESSLTVKELKDKYAKIKQLAIKEYLDPIDFPQEVKERLRGISRKIAALDPKTPEREEKRFKKSVAHYQEKDAKEEKVKGEFLSKYPDFEAASKINNYTTIDKKRALSLLKESRFNSFNEVNKYLREAKEFKKGLIEAISDGLNLDDAAMKVLSSISRSHGKSSDLYSEVEEAVIAHGKSPKSMSNAIVSILENWDIQGGLVRRAKDLAKITDTASKYLYTKETKESILSKLPEGFEITFFDETGWDAARGEERIEYDDYSKKIIYARPEIYGATIIRRLKKDPFTKIEEGELPKSEITDASSSADLKQRIKALGLDPEGKSVKQMELMLGMAQWAEVHPGEPFPEEYDPMLIHDKTDADPDWIDKVLNSNDWIIQTKVNGMRSLLQLNFNAPIKMTSRSRSVKDFAFTPHQDNVLGFQDIVNPFKGKTVFDGELFSTKTRIDTGSTITESPLQAVVALVHMRPEESLKIQAEQGKPLVYRAFDMLWFDGENIQDYDFEKRDELLRVAVSILKNANPDLPIDIPETIYSYDSAFKTFKEWVERGEEGVVVKKRTGKYQQGYRTHDQVKLKAFITVDGYITGQVMSSQGKGYENLIGGFRISALVDGVEKEIAAISNIPLDVRKAATVLVDGKPELNPEYLNKCVEMIGQEWGKNGRLGSARINEWRPDKDPSDCKLTAEEISPKDWSSNDK